MLSRGAKVILKQIEEKIKRNLINFKESFKKIGILIGGSIRLQDYPLFTKNKFISKLNTLQKMIQEDQPEDGKILAKFKKLSQRNKPLYKKAFELMNAITQVL